jgi:hypothetical protein
MYCAFALYIEPSLTIAVLGEKLGPVERPLKIQQQQQQQQ